MVVLLLLPRCRSCQLLRLLFGWRVQGAGSRPSHPHPLRVLHLALNIRLTSVLLVCPLGFLLQERRGRRHRCADPGRGWRAGAAHNNRLSCGQATRAVFVFACGIATRSHHNTATPHFYSNNHACTFASFPDHNIPTCLITSLLVISSISLPSPPSPLTMFTRKPFQIYPHGTGKPLTGKPLTLIGRTALISGSASSPAQTAITTTST